MFGLGNLFGQATIKFNADTGSAVSAIKRLDSTFRGLVGGLGGLWVANQAARWLNTCAEEAKKSEIANSALNKSLGNTASSMSNLIKQLSELSTFQDDDIKLAIAHAGAYDKNVENLKRLIPVIADFAAYMRMDLADASRIVTRAIYTNSDALVRYGIVVGKTSSIHDRFEKTLIALKQRTEGYAASMAKTDTGRLIQAQNAYKAIQAEIGKNIIPLHTVWTNLLIKGAKALNTIVQGNAILGKLASGWSLDTVKTYRWINEVLPSIESKDRANLLVREKLLAAIKEEADIRKRITEGDPVSKASLKNAEERVRLLFDALQELNSEPDKTSFLFQAEEEEDKEKERIKKIKEAEDALNEVRRASMERSLAGRLQLLDKEKFAIIQKLREAGMLTVTAEALIETEYRRKSNEERQKTFDEWLKAEQDAFDKRNEMLAKQFKQELEERKKALEDQMELERSYRQSTLTIIGNQASMTMAFSTALANHEISELKRTARSQAEYDKKKAEIEKQAALRMHKIALFQQGLAIAQAGLDMYETATSSASYGAKVAGIAGAIASAGMAIAEMTVLISEMESISIPEPKFELGKIGKLRRRQNDSILALIGEGETLIPAAQSAMHREELEAIRNNTANTAAGIKKLRGGTTIINQYGISTEQMLAAQVAAARTNSSGRRL